MSAHRGLLVIGVVTLVACSGAAASADPASPGSAVSTPRSTPAQTPPVTPGPAAGPTFAAAGTQVIVSRGWAANPPTPLLMGSAVRVTVAELKLYRQPWTSAPPSAHMVSAGNILEVGTGPIEADGYIWYFGSRVSLSGELPALPGNLDDGDGEDDFGWFTAATASMFFVAPVEPRCPIAVDLLNVAAMLAAERVACFGGRSIELEGIFDDRRGWAVAESYGSWEPAWLADPNLLQLVFWAMPINGRRLLIRFPPSGGPDQPSTGSIIRLRGHFHDDAAAACSMAIPYPWEPGEDVAPSPGDPVHALPVIVARQLCEQEFVVERLQVLRTDPSFSPPQ